MMLAFAAGVVAITAGTADAGDPAVAGLVDGAAMPCTGTLIAERVILTAAHCVSAAGPTHAVFGPSRASAERVIEVIDRRMHPGFDPTTLENDVALLLLADAPGYAPAALWDRALDASFGGRAVRVVGFGASAGTASDGGVKREGTARIGEVLAGSFEVQPDPSQPCDGDSGGPAFLDDGGGERIAGIASFGDPDCAWAGVEVRVDRHVGTFIEPYLIEVSSGVAPGGRCIVDDNCVEGICRAGDTGGFAYCSSACAGDADCPDAMICDDGACRYAAPEPGADGAGCARDADCAGDRCAQAEDGSGVCAARCFPQNADACPADDSCLPDLAHPGASACFADDEAAAPGGCATTRGGASPWLIAGVLAAIRRRRRRRCRSSR